MIRSKPSLAVYGTMKTHRYKNLLKGAREWFLLFVYTRSNRNIFILINLILKIFH